MDSPREGPRRVLSTLLQENTETHWEVFTLKGDACLGDTKPSHWAVTLWLIPLQITDF